MIEEQTPTPRPVPPAGSPAREQQSTTGPRPPTPAPRPVTSARPAPVRPAAQPTRAPASPPKSRLGDVRRGRLRTALRYLVYGPEGVGKSSLAADVPGVLFFDVEGGSPELDVARYPFRPDDAENGHVPLVYDDVTSGLDDLIANPGHGYSALALDTVDALEALIHKHICKRDAKSGIEAYGYGKGYRVALDEIRQLLAKLDLIRRQGVQVVFLGHSTVTTFKNPEGEDFDRYQLRLHALAAGQIKEWCDVVGFLRFEGGGAKLTGDESQSKRARGWATGRRLMHLHREAAWDAKCRLSLPAEIEITQAHPWAPLASAKDTARDATDESLHAEILAELDRVTGGDQEIEFVTPTGQTTSGRQVAELLNTTDAGVLSRVLAGLKATTAIAATKES